jgi:CheY-like chemotaxis protein
MHVLVVEDDEDFRLSLVDLLLKQGFDVLAAENASEALELVADADVMLTDISLGGMDGLELCGLARARHPELEVVVMTGYDSPGKSAEAERRGARGFLAKPFTKRDLLRCFDELVPEGVVSTVVPGGGGFVPLGGRS